MTTEATARAFFSTPFFAVVGASNNPAKFGHKSASSSLHTHQEYHALTITGSLRLVRRALAPGNANQPHDSHHNHLRLRLHSVH